jgi:hypothetical protein
MTFASTQKDAVLHETAWSCSLQLQCATLTESRKKGIVTFASQHAAACCADTDESIAQHNNLDLHAALIMLHQ